VISPNKQSQNANLSRVFTQIQFGLLRKLFREIQARAGLGGAPHNQRIVQ
jgi:hypothetical protein